MQHNCIKFIDLLKKLINVKNIQTLTLRNYNYISDKACGSYQFYFNEDTNKNSKLISGIKSMNQDDNKIYNK